MDFEEWYRGTGWKVGTAYGTGDLEKAYRAGQEDIMDEFNILHGEAAEQFIAYNNRVATQAEIDYMKDAEQFYLDCERRSDPFIEFLDDEMGQVLTLERLKAFDYIKNQYIKLKYKVE